MRSRTTKLFAALALVTLTSAAPAFAALDRSAPPASGRSTVQRLISIFKHWLHVTDLDEIAVPKP